MSWVATRADRTDRIDVLGVEHRGEPGEAVVDVFLEHDVGLVETRLRAAPAGGSSILTTSAGRSGISDGSAIGTPVSGMRGHVGDGGGRW